MFQLVFICSARSHHSIDWFNSAKNICELPPYILTDSKCSEGFENRFTNVKNVYDLFIIDRFLFKKYSFIGSIWRNIFKFISLPLQIYLLKKFSKRHPNSIYFAHGMYYMWICHFARVKYVGNPIGSEILVRTYKLFYKFLSILSLKSSLFIICDSKKMAKRIYKISKKESLIVQNGIEIELISKISKLKKLKKIRQKKIVSFRGITSLYRTKEIFLARQTIHSEFPIPIKLIYPFSDESYKKEISPYIKSIDDDLGTLSKVKLIEEFHKYILYISIPKSDSSPKSVYECILSGGIVAATREDYFDDLPKSLQNRIIIVDLNDRYWLKKSINKAIKLSSQEFDITKTNLDLFDQTQSFKLIYEKIHKVLQDKVK
tara:strand:+ start:878 stop:1999 length:1122 start_codon:yes stop_codon:yes gene_type:complete